MKQSNYVVIVVLLILVGAGSFYAGMKHQQSQPKAGQPMAEKSPRGGQFQGRLRQEFRPVNGEIISQDDKSITVKLPDGSSRIILVGGSVQINKSAPGTKEDLTKGRQVFVTGSENPDGSITAQSIQLNPMFRGK